MATQRISLASQRMHGVILRWALFGWMFFVHGFESRAQTAKPVPLFRDVTFEELANITVTTVSNRDERLFTAPAAVMVLNGDDAVRAGAVTLPDALRSIPGINVAQINGSSWGIGVRGNQTQFSSKLLVMIDGRSVYTPVFGGVFWDIQDYPLTDLDRIEVVLGPGGSVWGANAVNGVINIITRSAQDTVGDRVSVTAGACGESVEMRHGWRLNEAAAGRIYAKFISNQGTQLAGTGVASEDGVKLGRIGFRIDHDTDFARRWTFSGEIFRGTNDLTATLPTLAAPPTYRQTDTNGEVVQGGNLLAHWEAPVGEDGTLRFGASVDSNSRSGAIFDFRTRQAQADVLHSFALGARHEIDWGASVRYTAAELRDRWIAFSRDDYGLALWSVFAQDKIMLQPDRLALTAGVKFEHNDFTGLEPQPSVKLAWFPDRKNTLWAGWSRAVRTPSFTEDSNVTDVAVLPPGVRDPVLPAAIRGLGNPSLVAERLNAVELGWRWAPNSQWNVSVSLFSNRYENLIKVTGAPNFVQTTPVPALIIPLPEDNGMHARSTGGEFALAWQPAATWRFRLGVARTHTDTGVTTPDPFNFAGFAGGTPEWTVTASSTVRLATGWELTPSLRWVDALPNFRIPAYTEASIHLAWRPSPEWELALVGRNLLHSHHLEGRPTLAGSNTQIPRCLEFRVTWQR